MEIGIFTGGTSVRSKNIFTDISRYPTGKHEIQTSTMKIIELNWTILAVGFYTNTFVFATLFSFGSLFGDMLDKFNENISRTAMVQAILTGFGLTSGLFTGVLISRFGLRRISIVGGIMAPLGFILAFLATSITHLYICIGVIAGIGTSVIAISSTTAVSRSFSGSKRLLALAIQNTGMSAGGALTPYLFDYFVNNYGLNGTFLLIGGIYLNCLPAAILFSIPLENRVKNNNNEPKHTQKAETETQTGIASRNCFSSIYTEFKHINRHIREIMRSLFILIVLGVGFTMGSISGFFALILDILKWKGFTSEEALLSFPMTYGVGFLGRIIPGIVKQIRGISSFLCPFIFGMCGACGLLIFVLFSDNLILLIGCGFLGLAVAGVISGANIAIAKILDQEQISVGIGLMYSNVGIFTTIYGPTCGAIRDESQSYEVVLYLTFAFQVLGTMFFLVAMIARKIHLNKT